VQRLVNPGIASRAIRMTRAPRCFIVFLPGLA
jgi:hypothetical protein